VAAYLATLEYENAPIFRQQWQIRWLAYAAPWLEEVFEEMLDGRDGALALAAAQAKAEELWICLQASQGFADHERLKSCARRVDPGYPH